MGAENSTNDTHPAFANEPVALSHLLETNKTDVAFGILYFLTSRAEIADALLPFTDEIFYVYFLQPKHINSNTPFKGNFTRGVLLGILVVAIIASLALCLSINFRNKHSVQAYFDILSWAIGTICQQCPYFKTYKKWQTAFVVSLATLLSYFLYSIYCAIIIATLTKNKDPIRNLGQLFQHKYTFFAFKDTADVLLNGREVT